MFNVIVKWVILGVPDCLFTFFALLTSPVTSLFVDKNGNLPKLFKWWQTPDSNMFGVDGDDGFARDYKQLTETYWGRWWTALRWQFRNTGQGFSAYVVGIDDSELNVVEESWDDDGISNERTIAYRDQEMTKIVGFGFKGGFRWFFNRNYYFRYRIGWKFHFAASRGYKLPAQRVMSITPFKKI